MKNKISFLTVLTVACCLNYANASECIGDGCEFGTVYVTDESYQISEPVEYETDWVIQSTSLHTNLCPFDTESECVAWYRKPVYKTSIFPSAPHISSAKMNDMIYTVTSTYDVNANNSTMSPLLERYKMLMRASNACCGAGIVYKMRSSGATDADVYEFLKNDANEFAVTSRCMVMNDDEISYNYSNGVNGKMVADVRNACLCKNRSWFETLLQPFTDLYARAPGFESVPFTYSYTESMQREITVDINHEVQNTLGLMSVCPK